MTQGLGRSIIPGDTLPRGINTVSHPEYLDNMILWEKWRLTYGGGLPFINRYLKQFSTREDNSDFESRKELTYVPAFSKQAVDEIKYAITQRMCDIVRVGGPTTWQKAIRGEIAGVDLLNGSMNSYIAKELLTELLVKGKVGVYVDMPILQGVTLADKGDNHPYFQMYWAEDIRSWMYDDQFRGKRFTQLLLRDWDHFVDPVSGLPLAWSERYRYLYIDPRDGYVYCQYYNQAGVATDFYGNPSPTIVPQKLGIREIPFVVAQLDHSLMVDICDYQIAMMNMASADVDFCVKANYPFYVEQKDTRYESGHLKGTDNTLPNRDDIKDPQGQVQAAQASHIAAMTSTTPTIRTGVSYGRRYGIGSNAPAFIHPSSEPLKASMEKQAQMKAEIRELVHLSVARLDPAKASAESKMQDDAALENGLSIIGQELEKMERRIAFYWSMYEGDFTIPTIKYPTNYSVTTDDERRKAAKDLSEQMSLIPSKTYQKEIAKEIAVKLLGHKIPFDILEKIKKEIDEAKAITVDPKTIVSHLENHLVSAETASLLCGYEKGEAEKAMEEQAEKLAMIAESQAQAEPNSPNNSPGRGVGALKNPASRGIPEASANPKAEAKAEKKASRDNTFDANPKDKTRGEGK